jgi:hypothetical protein
MILVVEDRSRLETAAATPSLPARCSLQQTLRRMGFYAARAACAPAAPPARRRDAERR